MNVTHDFDAKVVWTGNQGTGNARYQGYARTWEVRTPGKPVIKCSNGPLLGGEPAAAQSRGYADCGAFGLSYALVFASGA